MENTSKEKKGGRPVKAVRRQRVNLTLHPAIRREAERLAFQKNRSLSGLVEYTLKKAYPSESLLLKANHPDVVY